MGEDWNKLSTLHFAIGFQIFALNMSQGAWYGQGWGGGREEAGEAIQAMIIIGFLLYCVSFILSCLMTFGDLGGNKMAVIATLILACVAVGALVIGLAVYGGEQNDDNNNIPAYTMTAYVMAAVLGAIGAVFLIMPMCGK